uniref:DDT domain-containing protein n=1 Tax=Steinernema glaseri TaxID=37863 RepID=A0A1I7Z4J4_9BILA
MHSELSKFTRTFALTMRSNMIGTLARLTRSPIAACFRLISTDSSGLPRSGEVEFPGTSTKKQSTKCGLFIPLFLTVYQNCRRADQGCKESYSEEAQENENSFIGECANSFARPRKVLRHLKAVEDGYVTLVENLLTTHLGVYNVELSNEEKDCEPLSAYDLRLRIDDGTTGRMGFDVLLNGTKEWADLCIKKKWVPDTHRYSDVYHIKEFRDLCFAVEELEFFDLIRCLSERQEIIMKDSKKLMKERIGDRAILLVLGMNMICKDLTMTQMREAASALQTELEKANQIYEARRKRDVLLAEQLEVLDCDFSYNALKKFSQESEAFAVFLALEKIAGSNPKNALAGRLSPPLDQEKFESLFYEMSKHAPLNPIDGFDIGKGALGRSFFLCSFVR